MSGMTEGAILALAEVEANLHTWGAPTEADFEAAEREVRAHVADGLTYNYGTGVWEL